MQVKKAFDITEELRDKINETVRASGLKDKEWIESVTNLWLLQDVKSGLPDYQQDLQELELHTQRVNELYLSMVNRLLLKRKTLFDL